MLLRCSSAAGPNGEIAGARDRRNQRCRGGRLTTLWLLLVRGDHDLKRGQGRQSVGLKMTFVSLRWPRSKVISDASRAISVRWVLLKPVKVVADRTVANMSDFIAAPMRRLPPHRRQLGTRPA